MQFNLFQWIREGVKRSVIMGVSDAIDQMGTPPDSEHLQNSLTEFLNHQEEGESAAAATATLAPPTKRKRLGRSLRELEGKDEEN